MSELQLEQWRKDFANISAIHLNCDGFDDHGSKLLSDIGIEGIYLEARQTAQMEFDELEKRLLNGMKNIAESKNKDILAINKKCGELQSENEELKLQKKKLIKTLSNIKTAYSNGEHVDHHWIKDEIELQASNERLMESKYKLENKKLKVDADKWQALICSKRIKIQGTGGLGSTDQHFGMEIWDKFPEIMDNSYGVSVLNTFTETIIKRNN